jgi:hypothetical protein
MSTRNLPGGKGQLACKADLTNICEQTVWKTWHGPPRPVTGIAPPTGQHKTLAILMLQRLTSYPFTLECGAVNPVLKMYIRLYYVLLR